MSLCHPASEFKSCLKFSSQANSDFTPHAVIIILDFLFLATLIVDSSSFLTVSTPQLFLPPFHVSPFFPTFFQTAPQALPAEKEEAMCALEKTGVRTDGSALNDTGHGHVVMREPGGEI